MKRLVLTVVAAGLAGPLLAQSLAEVAARDKERRARAGSPAAPAYTDTDLHASPSPSPSPTPTPAAPAGAGPRAKGWKAPASPSPAPAPRGTATPAPPSPEGPDRVQQEEAALEARWRAIARERRETLAKAEALMAALQERIDALRNDLSPVNLGDPNREQNRQAAITRALAEMEAAQAARAAARQAVEDLEGDVRRAGGQPGWVR
jgi:hypothetical protein